MKRKWFKYTKEEFLEITSNISNGFVIGETTNKTDILLNFFKCDYCGNQLDNYDFVYMQNNIAICQKCYEKEYIK